MKRSKRRAVFLDKDGTLTVNDPPNTNPQRVLLMPGVPEGLNLLAQHAYQLVVISNQSGIAQRLWTEEAVLLVIEKIRALAGAPPFAGVYICPHHFRAGCH